jgi:hypothetical protein
MAVNKMLLHIRPRLYSPFKAVELVDLEISPLDLQLVGAVDLATRRPYRNKRYAVACRKQESKAMDGILIETKSTVDEFVSVARWSVEYSLLVTHCVHYTLLDRDFDAASDDMTLWKSCLDNFGQISEDRTPSWAKGTAAVHGEPVMEVIAETGDRHWVCPNLVGTLDDVEKKWIVSRCEVFPMPTIDRGRIVNRELNERMPSPNMAFQLSF